MTRRQFTIAAAASSAAVSQLAVAETPPAPRFAALDAALVQSMLVLGREPVAMANLQFYRSFVIEPALPDGILELGLRQEPNLELLDRLRLDGILISPEFGGDLDRLGRIATVHVVPIYDGGSSSYLANARAAVSRMGEILDRTSQARSYEHYLDDLFVRVRQRVVPFREQPFCLFSFLSPATVRLHGANSLLGDALRAIGLSNATSQIGNKWGFLDVGVDRLAEMPGAAFVHIGEIPARIAAAPLWRDLPFVMSRRLVRMPTLWMFGGAPSAERFVNQFLLALAAVDGNRF